MLFIAQFVFMFLIENLKMKLCHIWTPQPSIQKEREYIMGGVEWTKSPYPKMDPSKMYFLGS